MLPLPIGPAHPTSTTSTTGYRAVYSNATQRRRSTQGLETIEPLLAHGPTVCVAAIALLMG